MDYRRLGNAGLSVSAIGLGGTTFGSVADEAQTARIVHQALDLGITFIDASASYGEGLAQEYVGKALGRRRGEAILSARLAGGPAPGLGPNERGMSRRRLIEGVHASLRRFGTDYIDLFEGQPPAPGPVAMEEMLRTLDGLVRDGKVRYLGASNYGAWQLVEAIHMARAHSLMSYVAIEARYNVLVRAVERELVPACQAYDIGIIPYTPLAGGFLSGKYRRGEPIPEGVRGYGNPTFASTLTDRNFTVLEALEGFARARDHTVGEVALAWLLAQSQVCTVIIGATRPEQVEENAKAAEWKLTAGELVEIEALTQAQGVRE